MQSNPAREMWVARSGGLHNSSLARNHEQIQERDDWHVEMRMPHVGVSGDDHWNADCILHTLSNSDEIPPKTDTGLLRQTLSLCMRT